MQQGLKVGRKRGRREGRKEGRKEGSEERRREGQRDRRREAKEGEVVSAADCALRRPQRSVSECITLRRRAAADSLNR